jgi:hypothetical protein
MGKYLHLFDTESAFTAAYNGNDYLEPWVSYTDETEGQEHVDYNKSEFPPCIEGYDVVFTHSKTETAGTVDIVCSTITTQEEFDAAKNLPGGLKVYSYGVDASFESVTYSDRQLSFTAAGGFPDKMPPGAPGTIYAFKITFSNGKLTGTWEWGGLS